MNYRTEKNDRIRRRKARAFTALITLAILTGFAYAAGLADELPTWFRDKSATEMADGPVARV